MKHTNEQNSFMGSMLSQGKQLGRSLADRGLPKPGEGFLKYTSHLTSSFKSHLAQSLKPYLGDYDSLISKGTVEIEEKKKRIETKLKKAEQRELTLLQDRQAMPKANYQTTNKWWVFPVLVILSIGEAILTASAFQIYDVGGSKLSHAFILFFFSIVYLFVPHFVVWVYHRTEHLRYKHVVRIALVAIFIMIYYVIAEMRMSRLKHVGETTLQDVQVVNPHTIPAWYFIFINMFLVAIGCYISSLQDSDETKQNNHDAKGIDDELRDIRAEKAKCEADLDAIPDSITALQQRISRQSTEAETIRLTINAQHRECINTVISENLLYRPDPDQLSFAYEDIPEL